MQPRPLTDLTDEELIESIEYLKTRTHLGSLGDKYLREAQAEAIRRKLKI